MGPGLIPVVVITGVHTKCMSRTRHRKCGYDKGPCALASAISWGLLDLQNMLAHRLVTGPDISGA